MMIPTHILTIHPLTQMIKQNILWQPGTCCITCLYCSWMLTQRSLFYCTLHSIWAFWA